MTRRPPHSSWIAFILAISSGVAVNVFAAAGMWAAIMRPDFREISDNYVALIAGTLGVMIGALAAYIGGRHHCDCPCHNTGEDGDDA